MSAAVGAYLFYARIGLASSFTGIIIAQTTIASPSCGRPLSVQSLANFDGTLLSGQRRFLGRGLRHLSAGDAAADPAGVCCTPGFRRLV